MVAEQRGLLKATVMPGQDLVKQPLAAMQVACRSSQPSADLHHQLSRQKLQAVDCAQHPLIRTEAEQTKRVGLIQNPVFNFILI